MRGILKIPSKKGAYQECIEEKDWDYKKLQDGSTWIVPLLIANDIRILIYSGTTDKACPTLGNQRWINALKLPIKETFKQWRFDG